MRRCFALLLAVVFLLLLGCRREEPTPATELTVWVTTEENGAVYGSLAEAWNAAYPNKQIDLNVQVYSSQRIAAKLSRGASVGTSFSGDDLPDLVEIDYATFPQYVFQQTTDLYPLKNMLEQNVEDPSSISGVTLYSSNDICFGLPYHEQQLVLCYRLDLEEKLSGFRWQAGSFEGLMALGEAYFGLTGEPILWVDYLGSETFLALFTQALQSCGDFREAYDLTLAYLKQMESSGETGYLSSGDAYAEGFPDRLARGEITCLVTTQANLKRLARENAAIGELYGVLPLPSFCGARCTVTAPSVAVSILMSGKHVVLARDFLQFCRFSDAAGAYAMFDLRGTGGDIVDNLSQHYRVSGNFSAPAPEVSFTASQIEEYLTAYSRDVLGIE